MAYVILSSKSENSISITSCNLKIRDFFIWPYIKKSIYSAPMRNLDELKIQKHLKRMTTHRKYYIKFLMDFGEGQGSVFKPKWTTFTFAVVLCKLICFSFILQCRFNLVWQIIFYDSKIVNVMGLNWLGFEKCFNSHNCLVENNSLQTRNLLSELMQGEYVYK